MAKAESVALILSGMSDGGLAVLGMSYYTLIFTTLSRPAVSDSAGADCLGMLSLIHI